MWTRTTPNKSGWWWLRVDKNDTHPMVVKVCHAGMGMMGLWTIGKAEMTIIGEGGEWQPVAPPKD